MAKKMMVDDKDDSLGSEEIPVEALEVGAPPAQGVEAQEPKEPGDFFWVDGIRYQRFHVQLPNGSWKDWARRA